MFQPKISKEEINLLPIEEFSGKIVVVDSESKVNEALDFLFSQKMLGLDTETKPSFKRGVVHKVSLLQISSQDICYLFRLNKIGFPVNLIQLLSDERILKIGLALRDDLNGLFKQHNFKPKGFIDLQDEVRNYGILELGLQKIYGIIFGNKISKSQRLTNWENNELTEQQQRYAATDAWATLRIYQHLLQYDKLSKAEIEKLVIEHTVSNVHSG